MIKHDFTITLTGTGRGRGWDVLMGADFWNEGQPALAWLLNWRNTHFTSDDTANGAHLRVSFGSNPDFGRKAEWRRNLTTAECEGSAFLLAVADAARRAHEAYEVVLEVPR